MSKRRMGWELHSQQQKAGDVLHEVLSDDPEVDIDNLASQSDVVAELHKEQLLREAKSDRSLPRLLYITDDLHVLEDDSPARTLLLDLSTHFDELHVVVTASLRESKRLVERLGDNVWLYTTGHAEWWRLPFKIKKLAKEQLVFTDGFRPDLVVATNPFAAGLGAYWVANQYHRPLQIHVTESYWTPEFLAEQKYNKWRRRIARYVLNRVSSIRTTTNEIDEYIKEQFSATYDVKQLPRYYNIQSFLARSTKQPTKHLYDKSSFVMLFVGRLDHDSTCWRAIDAAKNLLKNNSVVLVVVGDGPAKSEFQERAKLLGIDRQVAFKPHSKDLSVYFAGAHIGIVTDTDEASDNYVIKAAASGVPLLMAKTKLREDLFTDGTSGYLCEPTDVVEMTQKLTKFLNTPALRNQFSGEAQRIVKNRLYEDPETFQLAYANSILQVFDVTEPEAAGTENAIISAV